jgi:hypothetical protein
MGMPARSAHGAATIGFCLGYVRNPAKLIYSVIKAKGNTRLGVIRKGGKNTLQYTLNHGLKNTLLNTLKNTLRK